MTLTIVLCLLGLLVVANAVATAALIRQVGILHLRLQPVAGLQGGGGPGRGSQLALPSPPADLVGRRTDRLLVGFLSPTCGICGPLTTAFGHVAKSEHWDTGVLLIIDAAADRAAEYVREKGVAHIPHLADPLVFRANVPGAPWAVVIDERGIVLASGGVNTLENIEEMLAIAGPMSPDDSGAVQLSSSQQFGEVQVHNVH